MTNNERINAMSVEEKAEPIVHGHWIYWAGDLQKCSVCGFEYTDYLERNNYCGRCGAKMDGDAE